jgi:hypothetical protein
LSNPIISESRLTLKLLASFFFAGGLLGGLLFRRFFGGLLFAGGLLFRGRLLDAVFLSVIQVRAALVYIRIPTVKVVERNTILFCNTNTSITAFNYKDSG